MFAGYGVWFGLIYGGVLLLPFGWVSMLVCGGYLVFVFIGGWLGCWFTFIWVFVLMHICCWVVCWFGLIWLFGWCFAVGGLF